MTCPKVPEESPLSAIYERDGQWYHTDETWADEYGPFNSEQEAEQHLRGYIQHSLGG